MIRACQGDYLGLLLFGLLNPVVESMRGLCAATELRRVQREVSTSGAQPWVWKRSGGARKKKN